MQYNIISNFLEYNLFNNNPIFDFNIFNYDLKNINYETLNCNIPNEESISVQAGDGDLINHSNVTCSDYNNVRSEGGMASNTQGLVDEILRLGAVDSGDLWDGSDFLYRRTRENNKILENQKKFDEKWSSTLNFNFPYKTFSNVFVEPII